MKRRRSDHVAIDDDLRSRRIAVNRDGNRFLGSPATSRNDDVGVGLALRR